MGFREELAAKVCELVQVAWAGMAHRGEDDREWAENVFDSPQCDPDRVWQAYEPFFNMANPQDGVTVPDLLLDAAEEVYEAQFKHFEGVAGHLEEWQGDSATAFKRRLEDIWWASAAQQRMIEEMSTLYKAYLELITGTQRDIMTIAQATVDALSGYREQKRRQEQAANMAAVGLVITAVATVVTAGVALPAGATAVAANAALASSAVKVTETLIRGMVELNAARRVQGENPDEIVNSMFHRIDELLEDTDKQVEAFCEGFREAEEVLLAPGFVPAPPAEAYEQFDPEEFRVPSDIMPDSNVAAASHDPLLESKQPPPQP